MAKKSQTDYSHLCGWIEPKDRTDEMHEADASARARMPKFAIYGSTGEGLPDKVVITDLYNSEEVQASLGFKFPGVRQVTGACVGAAGGNVGFSTLVADTLIYKLPHKIIVPNWLLAYGKSRSRSGMRGKGEGSFGTAFADAARLDGWLDAAAEGLPPFKEDQGLVWGQKAEMAWSDGNAIDQKWLEMAKHNLIGTTAVQDTYEGVKTGLQNWYAHTIATSHYCHPQNAKLKNGMVVGEFDTRGAHQTSFQGYMLHPDNGDMVYNLNQWGDVYPLDPITGLRKGCWVSKQSVNWALAQREVIAFSGLNGFQARTFRWVWGKK